jgi:hypothetical protein
LKCSPYTISLQQPLYYTEEEFGKRLLGNSFSIPTVKWFLKPIATMFETTNITALLGQAGRRRKMMTVHNHRSK